MALTRREAASLAWKTYEVCTRGSTQADHSWPFTDALPKQPKELKPIGTKMRMVQELGWPEAKRQLKDDHGHPLIVKKDDKVWLLKCKPGCWRLYFYIPDGGTERRIIYVHAVCKQANKEDATDATTARRIADGIGPGGSGITAFEFPLG